MIRLVQDMRTWDVDCDCACGTTVRVSNLSPLMTVNDLEREGWNATAIEGWGLRTICPVCCGGVCV